MAGKLLFVVLRGFLLRGFWKVQGFRFSVGKALQNSPVTQVRCKSASWWPLLSRRALTCPGRFPTGKGKPCTFKNPLSENPLGATNIKLAAQDGRKMAGHVPGHFDILPSGHFTSQSRFRPHSQSGYVSNGGSLVRPPLCG